MGSDGNMKVPSFEDTEIHEGGVSLLIVGGVSKGSHMSCAKDTCQKCSIYLVFTNLHSVFISILRIEKEQNICYWLIFAPNETLNPWKKYTLIEQNRKSKS